jgi:hypothetical protein
MTEILEGRVARARRERLLAQFVDRSAEMALFAQVLDSNELPIMVVSADAGNEARLRLVFCPCRDLKACGQVCC